MTIQYLLSASTGLTIFIIALVLGKKNRSLADYILVAWLSLFILNFVSIFLLNLENINHTGIVRVIFELSEASILLHGPFLFFYTLALTAKSLTFRPLDLLHAVPFVLGLSILLIGVFKYDGVSMETRNLLLFLKMSSVLVYTLTVLKTLHSHRNSVEDIFSNIQEKYLTWLSILAWGILVVWCISIVSLLIHRYTAYTIPQYGGLLTNISISVFVFVIGYFGIQQPNIFLESRLSKINREKEGDVQIKYEKSGLSLEMSKKIHASLIELMNKKQPYLDPELTLFTLAEMLGIPSNHLSQVINSVEGKNFFDFINRYRVEHVKEIINLNKYQNFTHLGIALDSGFNSKSSFYRAFKKFTGVTPSSYKDLNH